MDENKVAKLQEVGYEVYHCCTFCVHGQFVPGQDFGTCALFEYEHLKHTGSPRQMSVTRFGGCLSWEVAAGSVQILGQYIQLLTP